MAERAELSAEGVQEALREIQEVLSGEAVRAFGEAAADDELWARAKETPREYLLGRGVELSNRLEITLGRGVFGPGRWPGRRCFVVCRSVDPVPPPPDPTGIKICVSLCLPGREPLPPPGPAPPFAQG